MGTKNKTKRWGVRRYWRRMGITTKFGLGSGLMLVLIIVVAAVGYVTMTNLRHDTEDTILSSTDIRRVVLEMDSGLDQARRLETNFLYQYPLIGLEDARETYVPRAREHIDEVIVLSTELQQLVAESDVSDELQQSDVNLTFYLSAASRHRDTFNEAVELVASVAAPETGLQDRLSQTSDSLLTVLTAANDPNLTLIHSQMLSVQKDYLLSRQRPFMQLAFNIASQLGATIEATPALDATQKAQAQSTLDEYQSIADELLQTDVGIRSRLNEFEFQDMAIEPISEELVTLANEEIERASSQIDTAARWATTAFIVVTLAALVLAFMIARVLNKSVTHKVVRLTQAASEMRSGNLAVTAEVSSEDELGLLAGSFNDMSARINELVGNLEHKVDELRTEIEQRERAEEALRESEEKYRLVVDNIPSSIQMYDRDGTMLFMNAVGAGYLGGTPEDFVGKSLNDVFPDQVDFFVQRSGKVMDSGLGHEFEDLAALPSGRLWFKSNVQPVRDASGNVYAVQVVSEDITERKQAEENLKASEKKYRELYEGSIDGYVRMNIQGYVLESNRAYKEMLGGYSDEELRELTYPEFTPPKWSQMETEIVEKQVMARGYSDIYEKEYIRKDGTVFPVELRAYLIENEKGVPTGMWAFVSDISERKQAEDKLRASEERFRALVENAFDGIALLDANGNLLYESPSSQPMLGYQTGERPATNMYDFAHPEDQQRIAENHMKLLEEPGSTLSASYRAQHKDGTWRILETMGKNMIDDPKVGGVVVNFRDITERTRAEEALRASEEKFATIFRATPCVVSVSRASDDTYIDVNEMYCQVSGYSHEEAVGSTPADLGVFASTEEQHRIVTIFRETGSVSDHELDYLTKEGRTVTVRMSMVPIEVGGEPCVLAIAVDVTEQKQAENELRESEEKFRTLVENSPAIIYLVDRQARIQFINRRQPEYQEYEVIGRSLYDFIPPQLKDAMEERVRDVFQKGYADPLESSFSWEGGSEMWFETRFAPVWSKDEVVSFISIVTDITYRKQAEEELRKSEERLRILSEAAFEAIVIHDSGNVLLANDQFYQMFGRQTGEAFSPAEALIPDSLTDVKKRFAFRDIGPYEVTGTRKDGSQFPIEVQVRTMEYGGTTASVAAMRDITAHKLAEEQIQAQLKEKVVLLQEIHHRVKNNLQIICSLLSLQSQKIKDTKNREMFSESEARVRAMSLVHEQLYQSKDLAKIGYEAYLRRMANSLFASHGISQDVIALNVEAKDVSLDINMAIPCGLIVNELITNSLKYAFPAGRKGEIRIVLTPSDEMLTLTVSDNGIGLPHDFDFRDAETLGLRLVNILTNQLGGTIELDTSKGTEFRITFAYQQVSMGV